MILNITDGELIVKENIGPIRFKRIRIGCQEGYSDESIDSKIFIVLIMI